MHKREETILKFFFKLKWVIVALNEEQFRSMQLYFFIGENFNWIDNVFYFCFKNYIEAQAMCQNLIGHVTCALVYKGFSVENRIGTNKLK